MQQEELQAACAACMRETTLLGSGGELVCSHFPPSKERPELLVLHMHSKLSCCCMCGKEGDPLQWRGFKLLALAVEESWVAYDAHTIVFLCGFSGGGGGTCRACGLGDSNLWGIQPPTVQNLGSPVL